MSIALVTGSSGLVGSESVRFFAKKGFRIIGIDNDMRKYFFGEEASTSWSLERLKEEIPGFIHFNRDIRNMQAIEAIFQEYNRDIKAIIHCAAQPSHDWAAREPLTDFTINANGTLHLLELTREYAPDAVFIFMSTNKVYGDVPNRLPLVELENRWEISEEHPYYENGIDERMSLDYSTHSLFGVSKAAADLMVQEYGRYFGMKTGCFRGGCLTGPNHSAAPLHGFLAYLMKCAITGENYNILGYKGKQVRDNIHSLDLVNMFWNFYLNPRSGEVYNAGGGRDLSCSILEAIAICEEITGRKMRCAYIENNRIGDHVWWISDTRKFKQHYPEWRCQHNMRVIMKEIYISASNRAHFL